MRTATRLMSGGFLAGLVVLAAGSQMTGQPAGKPTLPTVSYAELGKMVRGLKGKVAVVYFWADY